MKIKLFIVIAIVLVYVTANLASGPGTSFCESRALPLCTFLADGTDPPHAVDVSGKVIPESSAIQPDKPIILAKDSQDENFGELKISAAFDHAKHSTDAKYSLDGQTVMGCVECHHTAQPLAPKGQEHLKTFDRKETLTTKQLETSKEPVQSCRTCHFQAETEPSGGYPPKSLTYPKSTGKKPTGELINKAAYHINCNSCHDAAAKRDPKSKAPIGCVGCHTSGS